MDIKAKFNPSTDSGRGPSAGSASNEAKRAEGHRAGEMSILMPTLMAYTIVYMALMVYPHTKLDYVLSIRFKK